MPSNHLILCRPLLLLSSIFPSIRVFSNESVLCIRWPKYWSFSFSISASNEYSELISFRMDWLDLLLVQRTLKNGSSPTPQFKSINSSALSFPYSPTLSHPYMNTGKTIALTRWTFVGKVMCLLFNMLFESESESEVSQSCLTLCDPMDCSLPGSSIHGIFQARVLEWVAVSFSRRSSQPRDQTQVSRITGRRFTL